METAPLFPLTILLLGGVGVYLAGRTLRGNSTRPAVLSWMILLGAFLACIRLWGVRLSTFGLLGSDLPSQFLSMLVLFGVAGTLPLVRTTFLRGEIKEEHASRVFGSVLVASAGMLLMISTRNLGIIFLAIEVVWIGFVSFSVGLRSENRYLTLTSGISSLALILGLVLFWIDTGQLDVASIETVLLSRGLEPGWISGVALWSFVLGLVFKVAAIHFGRRARGSAFALSATVQVAVFGTLLRVTSWSLVSEDAWKLLLGGVAVVFFGLASLMMARSGIGHRSWSFVQLGQVGVILMGLTVGGEAGRCSVLLYLVSYIFASVGVVGTAVAFESNPADSALFSSWKGMGWRHPVLAGAMGVFLFSFAGVPPTIGFWGRFQVYLASVEGGFALLLGAALLNMLFGYTFYLRPLTTMWMDTTADTPRTLPATIGVKLAVVVCVGVVLISGVVPEPLLSLTQRVALELF